MALPKLTGSGGKMIPSGSKIAKTANIGKNLLKVKSKKTVGQNFGDKKSSAITVRPKAPLAPLLAPTLSKTIKKNVGTQTSTKTSSGGGKGTLEEDVRYIKDKVIEIDKLLKGSFSQKRREEEQLAKQSSDTERKKKEGKYEKGGSGILKGMGNKVKKPFSNIWEGIKNYITAVLLGFIAIRLVPLLPKLIDLAKIIAPAIEFLIDAAGFLLNGLVTFIDWGYKAYDSTRGFVEKLGGENAAKAFDKFGEIFNQVMNLSLILAMAGAAGGGFGSGRGGRPGAGARGGGPKVTTSGGKAAGRPDLRNPLRDRPKVTTTGGSTAGRPDLRNPLRQRPKITGATSPKLLPAAGELGEQGLKKSAGKFIRPLVKRLPVIGGLVDFAIAVALGESLGRAAFRAIGATLLGAVGAAAGSVVPGAGTFLGGLAGGMAGDAVGGVLYDMIFAGKKPELKSSSTKTNKQKLEEKRPWWDKFGIFGGASAQIKKKQAGGYIDSFSLGDSIATSYASGGLLGKSSAGLPGIGGMMRLPPIPKINLPKLTPSSIGGAIVGGVKKLFSFFGFGGDESKPPSYVEGLINLANKVKDVPLIGGSMFAAIQLALGMKVDRRVLESVGGQLTNFSNLDAFKGITASASKLSSTLKFEEGGQVVSTVVSLNPSDNKKSVMSLSNYLDKEIKSIELELEEEEGGKGGPGDGGGELQETEPGGGGVKVTGGNADFWTLVAIASREDGEPQSWADVAQSIYNRAATGMYTGGKNIKNIITAGGQYEPTFANPKDWKTISDINTAAKASGKSVAHLNKVAAALRDPKLQANAASFVGGRTDFMGESQKGSMKPNKGDITRGPGDNYFGWFYNARLKGPAKIPSFGDIAVTQTKPQGGGGGSGGGFLSSFQRLFGGGGRSGGGGQKQQGPVGDVPKGSVVQWLHGNPNRKKGYDLFHAGQKNAHDHFSFNSRSAAVNAFKKLEASGYRPWQLEGYTRSSGGYSDLGKAGGPEAHSAGGGHYGKVGGKPTYDKFDDGHAFDIPWSTYGTGPIGKTDYAKSDRAAKIVGAAQGGGVVPGAFKGLQQTMNYDKVKTRVVVQPMIIEKEVPIPMPMGGGTKVVVASGEVNSMADNLFAG